MPGEVVVFEIPGVPVPKGRAKASRFGATGIRMRTPKETVEFEGKVAWLAKEAMGGRPLLEGPLRADIEYLYPALKGTPKRDAHKRIPKATKPDGDNLDKAILDALNGIAYRDDAQVFARWSAKWHAPVGEPARIIVKIREVEGNT